MISDTELEFLKESLSDGTVFVKFIKFDGTEREMLCTKDFSQIPLEFHPISEIPETADLIRVFDINLQEWRSFKPSRLISWSLVV